MMISVLVLITFVCFNSKEVHAQATISLKNGEYYTYEIIMFTTSATTFSIGQAVQSLSGTLIPISFLDPDNSDTACSRFQLDMYINPLIAESLSSYPTVPFEYSWVALVRRGGCELADKVKNVQAIGAMAIVVRF
jgi:hypothetical protein